MKILITGGSGFIGSNVVDGYIREGHVVVVVDNLYTGNKANLNPKANFYAIDIRSSEIKEIFEREKPEILNHHAAQISALESVSYPILDADINMIGFLNLLENAIHYKTRKVIFSSSAAVYGDAEEYPTSEKCMPKPLSPYAISKFCSEYYLAYYAYQYGLEYTILRYANIYGPRQVPHGEGGVIGVFISNLLEGKSSVLNHFANEPNGMIRDYCFVGDVVQANINSLVQSKNDVFNIGTGKGTDTLDLYNAIYKVLIELKTDFQKPHYCLNAKIASIGDTRKSCFNVAKAKEKLGWIPETDLDTGIKRTIQWWLDKRNMEGKDKWK